MWNMEMLLILSGYVVLCQVWKLWLLVYAAQSLKMLLVETLFHSSTSTKHTLHNAEMHCRDSSDYHSNSTFWTVIDLVVSNGAFSQWSSTYVWLPGTLNPYFCLNLVLIYLFIYYCYNSVLLYIVFKKVDNDNALWYLNPPKSGMIFFLVSLMLATSSTA
jgi:hypothetical protein